MIKSPESREVAIIDFGLAYHLSESSKEAPAKKNSSAFGTPDYASLNAHERSGKTLFRSRKRTQY